MTAAAPTRAVTRANASSWWFGDPAIIVYALRWALGLGGHVAEFTRQAIVANAPHLPAPVRAAAVRHLRTWLDDGANAASPDRPIWTAALEALEAKS